MDNLSVSSLSATFGCQEKIPLSALDEAVWIRARIIHEASYMIIGMTKRGSGRSRRRLILNQPLSDCLCHLLRSLMP